MCRVVVHIRVAVVYARLPRLVLDEQVVRVLVDRRERRACVARRADGLHERAPLQVYRRYVFNSECTSVGGRRSIPRSDMLFEPFQPALCEREARHLHEIGACLITDCRPRMWQLNLTGKHDTRPGEPGPSRPLRVRMPAGRSSALRGKEGCMERVQAADSLALAKTHLPACCHGLVWGC